MDRKRAVLTIAWLLTTAVAAPTRAAAPLDDWAAAAAAFDTLAPADPSAGGDPRAWRSALGTQAEQRHALQPGVDLTFAGESDRLVVWMRVAGAAARSGVPLALPGSTAYAASPQGHARLTLPDGDLALLRPAAVVDDGSALQPVNVQWADAGPGRVRLVFSGAGSKLSLLVRFEALFLSDPAALRRHDRNGDGRIGLDELVPALDAPSGSAAVTATKTDALVTDTGTIGQANPGDVIGYTVTVTGQGDTSTALNFNDTIDADTTLVAGSVNVSPLALDDTYAAVGNVTLDVNTALTGIFGNDREFPVGTLTTFTLATAGPNAGTQAACGSFPCLVTTAQGGTVTLKAPGDGRFTYTAPASLAIPGTDTFAYVITDGALTGSGTVTFNVDGRVWFVDRDVAPGGTGTQASPFHLLATVNGAGGLGDPDGPNDIIYLHDRAAATDYVNGVELEAGQRLVGSGVPLIVNGNTLLAATTAPVIEHATGNAITLIAGTVPDGRPHIEGLHVNAANNAAIHGTGVSGTVDIDSVTINTSGTGAGLSLTNHSGTLTFDGSIGGSGTGAALLLNGGNGSVALAGAAINKTAGRLVDVQNKTGGAVAFGALNGTGAATDAIVVQNNTGATLNFASGFSVTTTAGRGLFASNGGTLTIGGTATIDATGAAALDVSGTSFGAGATLASASSTGSSAEGVRLANVSGPLTINGGAISGSTGTAFALSQGSAAVTYAGTISKTNAGRAVDVQTRSGGTATFSGAITASGASTGINVSGATAPSTTTFSGAVDLGSGGSRLTGGTALTVNHGGTASTTSFSDVEIFTNGQAGVNASNGGTLNVTTGRIDAQNGRALNADALAVGATFLGMVSSGSASEGVRVNAATGSLTSVATTISNPSTQGLLVQSSSLNADFGTTQVSGSGTQRVLVTGSTGNVTFAGTTLTGGTDGVSLQSNTAGTRTFASLNVSGNSGIGFLHAVGGGATTVTGTATITNPGGTGVDIQSSTTAVSFNGLTVNKGASAGTGVALTSNTVTPALGTLAVTTSNGTGVSISSSGLNTTGGSIAATSGPAINASGGVFNATFASVSSTNSASQGLNLTNSSGTLTMSGGAISGSAGTAVNVSGGSVNATHAGTVTQNNAQRSVDVQSTTGGAVALGTVTAGASSTGVNINAANGNVSFTSLTHGTSGTRTANQAVTINGGTGTYGLGTVSIFTTGARGLSALNADGTLNSTTGTIDASGAAAAAVDIDGPAGLTTLGMTLTRVDANGATRGISVQDTNGSLSILGTGAAGTGGTIQNTSEDGVFLQNATNVTLAFMNFSAIASGSTSATGCNFVDVTSACRSAVDLNTTTGVTLDDVVINLGDAGQEGVSGLNVNGLTITDSQILNVGDADNESGVLLQNLRGTVLFEDLLIDDPVEYGVRVYNPSPASALALTLRRTTIQNNINTFGEAAFQIEVAAGAATVLIDDSDFLNTDAGIHGTASGAAGTTLNMTVLNTNFNENRSLPHGVNFTLGNQATGRLNVDGAVMTGCATSADCSLAVDLDASIASTLDARVQNSTATNTGIGGGLEFVSNENAAGRAHVSGNNFTMGSAGRIGMNFNSRSVSGTQAGTLDLTLTGNAISGIDSGVFGIGGMNFQSGSSVGTHNNSLCANLDAPGAGGNVINGTATSKAYYMRQRTATNFRLQGIVPATGATEAQVESFVQTNNAGGTLAGSTDVAPAGGTTILDYRDATCATPTAPPLP